MGRGVLVETPRPSPYDKVAVLDFGGQYAHLIVRRVREAKVYSELLPHPTPARELAEGGFKGVILSGGPASVYSENAPTFDPAILNLGIPILGICYGLQLLAHHLGGVVERGARREYGKAELTVERKIPLFQGLGDRMRVWMSHGDYVKTPPVSFKILAHTPNSPAAAVGDGERRLYGVQFHPEVAHTPKGGEILRNFLYQVCGCKPNWTMEAFIQESVDRVRVEVGEEGRVLCALSGGVDSSVTAALISKALGERLVCVFVDHGLLRKGEAEEVVGTFRGALGIELIHVEAGERFLSKLRGVGDPERKRRIVGEEFIRVFEEEASRIPGVKWLAQGTLYPDVIESARAGGPASQIKTHHNVGGLPERMGLKLIEPLRFLYKDEVREVARRLGLPPTIYKRHPFPGPGLAVRIIGQVTPEKLKISREASGIVEEELVRAGLYDEVWQAFAVVGEDVWVGVMGDERSVGRIVTVRVVESTDAMTADSAKLEGEVLRRISNRITNEVGGVSMVTYALSSKPPSTIEPC